MDLESSGGIESSSMFIEICKLTMTFLNRYTPIGFTCGELNRVQRPYTHREREAVRLKTSSFPSNRSLAYYSDLSDAIFIILRSGFEWIPFLGWVRISPFSRR